MAETSERTQPEASQASALAASVSVNGGELPNANASVHSEAEPGHSEPQAHAAPSSASDAAESSTPSANVADSASHDSPASQASEGDATEARPARQQGEQGERGEQEASQVAVGTASETEALLRALNTAFGIRAEHRAAEIELLSPG